MIASSVMELGLITVIAAVAAYVIVLVVRRVLTADIPNERSSHTRPVPRGGGLAIVAVTLVGWLLLARASWWQVAAYVAAAGGIALVSWIDDRTPLSAALRLGVHAGGAVVGLAAFGAPSAVTLPLVGVLELGPLSAPLGFLWIVALTNFYNFMDGIDGLAGLQAVVAGAAWAAVGLLLGAPSISILGLLVGASSLGFLLHNLPPARVFMGDVGSAFLGFTFALLPSIDGVASTDPRMPIVAVLLVAPFVFDASLTIARRARNGERLTQAHRSHLYQRLVRRGYSHRAVSATYGVLAVLSALAGLAYLLSDQAAAVLGLVVLLMAALTVATAVVERRRPLVA